MPKIFIWLLAEGFETKLEAEMEWKGQWNGDYFQNILRINGRGIGKHEISYNKKPQKLDP